VYYEHRYRFNETNSVHRKPEKERIVRWISTVITVIVMMRVMLFRIIMFSIIVPGGVSGISINIIIGSIIWRTISRFFMELPLGMPARVVIIMPWIAIPCKRNTGTEKYQSGGDQENFLDLCLHRFSPSIVRF
jgi:hypothetical protein